MVVESLFYRKGAVLFAYSCDIDKENETIKEAIKYCKDNNLHQNQVAIKRINEENYKIILVKVK